ncbi:transcriptional regulator [Acrocarpospora phusangensis]|uniref:Transcriptional regulator n=1 Tax=Acrocarpospora phusangensis TaxID=1070424 RepID=A0A919UTF5_9ACTN|nr:ROK family transcriptional regulator [Acrocarpospora phusangensis]GIH29703.1 transcriptional regulator [Acrocarpospora phusangensis]
MTVEHQPGSRSAGVPADQATVRRANLSLVLRHVSARGQCSRSSVAAETGLNKTTISSLVGELQARGLVKEIGPHHAGSVGRPSLALVLDGSGVGALGVELNADYIAAFATDLAGRVLADRRIGFDAMGSEPERSLDKLGQVIGSTVAELDRRGVALAGLTVAVPGLVDTAGGTVVFAPNLGWRGVPMIERLRSAGVPAGVPMAVDNDANLAALAEYRSGVAVGVPNLIYLTGEVGVGCGIITGGRPLSGADGFAGEAGHVMVDPYGDECGCGRIGCWETKVGLAALVRMATPDRAYGVGPQVVRDPEERLAEIEQRRADGDPRAEAAVAEVGRWLGRGASTLVNLFNPQVIVLGGYFARLAEQLIPVARAELARLGMSVAADRCRFAASTLGFGAASRGGVDVVIERVLSDPTSIAMRP